MRTTNGNATGPAVCTRNVMVSVNGYPVLSVIVTGVPPATRAVTVQGP
jgi:hypothetical protein